MRRLASKRQRKQKNKISLSSKQFQQARGYGDDQIQLDRSAVKGIADSNALILPATKEGALLEDDSGDEAPAPKQLSKSQKRKLRRVEEERARKAAREGVLQSLQRTALNAEALAALRPISSRGQRLTKKETALQRSRMRAVGLEVSDSDDDVEMPETANDRGAAVVPGKGGHGRRGGESDSESDDESSASGESFSEEDASSIATRTRTGLNPWPEPAAVEVSRAAVAARLPPPPDLASADVAALVAQARVDLGLPASDREEDDGEGPARRPRSVPVEKLAAPRVVHVERSPEIQAIREGLPILGMEQEIMEMVMEHDVVVLSGETGCGKTTQVPQFLYEAGYGSRQFPERSGAVGITQPRRVGAISTAERVAEELRSKLGDVVGYQVRYDKALGPDAALKFMTDGILLRELQHDFLLSQYSCILVDEAHERSLNTDILLGLLSRVVKLRRVMHSQGQKHGDQPVWPLKLIIMSATLRVEDFLENKRLFAEPPPLITVPARQFPVTVHFSRRTELEDYVGATFKKASQIHRQLPPGGILVFLTGQAEVRHMCKRLEQAFGGGRSGAHTSDRAEVEEDQDDVAGFSGGDAAEAQTDQLQRLQLGTGQDLSDDEADDYDDLEAIEDEDEVEILGGAGFTPEEIAKAEAEFEQRLGIKPVAPANNANKVSGPSPVEVRPLYAMLSSEAQAAVFKPVPAGRRLIVVATNVAETSLTIPGIRYVVDAGRAKQRVLESTTSGVVRYEVGWISQASAAQRSGRAGRTGPGHCYRLFSSAVFNDQFDKHAEPEILGAPQENVVLSLKSMGVAMVGNFPFPTPPETAALRSAVSTLTLLGALEPGSEALTPRGRAMSRLPVHPRHASMLLRAAEDDAGGKRGTLNAAVALAAVLSCESPFVATGPGEKAGDDQAGGGSTTTDGQPATVSPTAAADRERIRRAQAALRDPDSDALSALHALGAYQAGGRSGGWASSAGLHLRHLEEAVALRNQLVSVLKSCAGDAELRSAEPSPAGAINSILKKAVQSLDPVSTLPRPGSKACVRLRRALLAGWPDRVARRLSSVDPTVVGKADGNPAGEENSSRSRRGLRYQAALLEETVYLHPASGLHRAAPRYVVYADLVRTARGRPCMSGVTAVEAAWLAELGPPLCTREGPLLSQAPRYDSVADAVLGVFDAKFGRHDWRLPRVLGPLPDAAERCVTFAAAMLLGEAAPALGPLTPALVANPADLARPAGRAQPRAVALLLALEKRGIDCRAALARQLARDPEFLLMELAAWYAPTARSSLVAAWTHQQ